MKSLLFRRFNLGQDSVVVGPEASWAWEAEEVALAGMFTCLSLPQPSLQPNPSSKRYTQKPGKRIGEPIKTQEFSENHRWLI